MIGKAVICYAVTIFLAQAAHCEDIPRYNRDLFGGWSDADQDCQNTRHELLQEARQQER